MRLFTAIACIFFSELCVTYCTHRFWVPRPFAISCVSYSHRVTHIQNALVSKIEPMLAEHLVHLGVEPQVCLTFSQPNLQF